MVSKEHFLSLNYVDFDDEFITRLTKRKLIKAKTELVISLYKRKSRETINIFKDFDSIAM